MKKLILGSVVTAALVFTGCGSDGDSGTTPVVENVAPVLAALPAAMVTGQEVQLSATDESVATLTFAETGDFTLTGNTLKAPDTEGVYNVTVTVTDSEGLSDSETRDINVTVAPPPSGITYGGLEWTPLIAEDENNTISGRQTQAAATIKCRDAGKRLPTLAELQDNALSLKPDTAFRADAPSVLIVWSGDVTATGYFFNGTDANVSNDDVTYDENDDATMADATRTNFYTCVPQ